MLDADGLRFLRVTPPFGALPQDVFDAVAPALEQVSFPAGARVIESGGPPARHLHVIRSGSVRVERGGQTIQVLEEGEIFGYTSLISGRATLDVVVDEDLVALRLPQREFEALLAHAAFAGHFAAGLAERLKHSLERSPVESFQPDLGVPVERLLHGPPVRIGPDATVGEAARLMSEREVGSVLVDAEPPGIVTDRDLRKRVLARGRGPETPIREVLSSPLTTVSAGTPLYEAWRVLLDAGVHHLPVTRDGEVVGILSAGAVLRSSRAGPVAVMKRVEQLPGREALAGYGAWVTEMVSSLFVGGLEPAVIGQFVARLHDTLLARILRWAEADLGRPPCPYAWLVFGSEGRREQLLLTDQDNALAWADDGPEAAGYFEALAGRVVADLQAAGFPACPGGYMATRWRGPLARWEERFRGWLASPTPQALLEAAIFFDFRRGHGTLPVASLEAILSRAVDARAFLPAMAKSALTFRVPSGLVLRLRGEASRVDLKLSAISCVVFLARVYGLEVGARSSNTIERLRAAAAAGLIARDTCETLAEAYRFLLRLRVREQLRTVAQGRPPGQVVSLRDLSSLERSRLRDVFRAIEAWQERATYHYRTNLF
jgi:CBS domain-containing protein